MEVARKRGGDPLQDQEQRSRETELHTLVHALCSTKQQSMSAAAEMVLRALLNGAVAMDFAARYEGPAAESVREFMRGELSEPEKPSGQ